MVFFFAACRGEQTQKKLVVLNPVKQLQAVRIQRSNEDSIRIPLSDTLIQSEFTDMDRKKQTELLTLLGRITLTDGFKVSPEELDRYGLKSPVLSVAIERVEGSALELVFGDFSNYAAKRYARVGSDTTIYLVSEEVFQKFNKKKEYFIDPNLITFPVDSVCSLQLKTEDAHFEFHKNSGAWLQVTQGRTQAADTQVLEMVLSTIQMLRSVESAPLGVSKVEFKNIFEIIFCGGESKSIRLSGIRSDAFDLEGEKIQVVVSDRPDRVYTINRSDAPVLDPEKIDFRRQSPTTFDFTAAYEVQLFHATNPRVYRREVSEWTVNGKAADRPFVESTIRALAELPALEYVLENSLEAAITQTRPFLEFRVFSADKNTLLQGAIWKDARTGRFYCREDSYLELFEIPAESIKKIFPELAVLYPSG